MNEHIIKGTEEQVTIMNYPFYTDNIERTVPHNYRERKFTPILGGTERVSQGEYVHREFSFTSIISYPPGRPDAYDSIFKKMQSKSVKVKSKSMGKDEFNAFIKLHISDYAPNRLQVDVTVTEVPGVKSRIDGENFKVPPVEKIKVESKKVKSSSKKTNSKSKSKSKNKSKTKSVKKKNK